MKKSPSQFLFLLCIGLLSLIIKSGFTTFAANQIQFLRPDYYSLDHKFSSDTLGVKFRINKLWFFESDTLQQIRLKHAAGMPTDVNFSYEKYAEFLLQISDTSKYIVLPIEEFRKIHNSNKIVIGLRHDVDVDLTKAVEFSQIESQLRFRSTYYILHTANYYLANPDNKSTHNSAILPTLKSMQNESHFEIGLHNDLVTMQLVYGIDPVNFLHQELNWLRSNGISIKGTSSHGSNFCYTYHYLNYYFFKECTFPVVAGFENNIKVPMEKETKELVKGSLSDFGLDYEAYFLDNNKYFSDAKFINGLRWNFSMLDIKSLVPGDRAIFLIHPIHWNYDKTPALKVANQTVEIPEDENNNIKFPVASTVKWTVQSDQTWLQIKNPAGEGTQIIDASATRNTSIHARTAKVLVTSTGLPTQTINIIQLGDEIETNIDQLGDEIEANPILAGHLQVYPNPSTGQFYINAGDRKFTSGTIIISTLTGQKILQLNVSEEADHMVNLNGLSSGTYLVKLISNNLVRSGKIIIHHKN